MAELTISAPVGAHPAGNRPADVRTVQSLLQKVTPPLSVTVVVTGTMDANTLHAIREFQKRFMQHPDGRVEPGARTLMHLNDGYASKYIGCDPDKRRVIDHDLIEAQRWLDAVNRRLGNTSDPDVQRKVKNIFNIDVTRKEDAARFQVLRGNFLRLRQSLDEQLSFQCEHKPSLLAAWVVGNDPTLHLPPNYFRNQATVRIAKIIHERSHTVLKIGHSGMAPGGEIRFGEAPDDPKGFSFDQAINNAWCYEYLVTALQPTYDSIKAREF